MIKLYCDRCGEKIKEGYYYTVNIHKKELHPTKTSISVLSDAMSLYAEKNLYESLYEQLSSEKMYCNKCKSDIEKFINSK